MGIGSPKRTEKADMEPRGCSGDQAREGTGMISVYQGKLVTIGSGKWEVPRLAEVQLQLVEVAVAEGLFG
jgi:hypothetical protein